MKCPKCKNGEVINLNGLFYECDKGCLEDSTLNMLMSKDSGFIADDTNNTSKENEK